MYARSYNLLLRIVQYSVLLTALFFAHNHQKHRRDMATFNFNLKNFNFSMKNIPIPNGEQYMKTLIKKTESFITRMRWKALFFLKRNQTNEDDSENETERENFGFKSSKVPPPLKETMNFERDLWQLVESVQFSNHRQPFQRKLSKEVSQIKKSNELFIQADKTRNFYQTKPETYKKLISDNITKSYKKIDVNIVDNINLEAKKIAEKLKLDDRIEKIPETEAFITLKDHKQNFIHQPSCRLINPTKTEMGIISQKILQTINTSVRDKTKLNQWRSTNEAIDWFNGLNNKKSIEFLQCDIVDFYPSITEDLLDRALLFASKHTTITAQDKEILHHARKTVLFVKGEAWTKKNSLFDVSMGAYDGAEVAELVGLFILSHINEQIPELNFGLYRDDGLAVYETSAGCKIDSMRKNLTKIFKNQGLDITATFRLHTVNFLDVTFDLSTDTYKPFRKPNDTPVYIHVHSNHPPHIKKQLPHMISNRLSTISSTKTAFEEASPEYNAALRKSGYNEKVQFKVPANQELKTSTQTRAPLKPQSIQTVQPPRTLNLLTQPSQPPPTNTNHNKKKKTNNRKRKRNVLWYNPPFNAAVTTNIGKRFLDLIDKHFPKTRSDNLHKIFNRHLIKLSYSCTPNMKSIIRTHNAKILAKVENQNQPTKKDAKKEKSSKQTDKDTKEEKSCNCRKSAECPLQGKCLQQTVVYKATIKTPTDTKTYIGSTENTFKQRYYAHKNDMNKIQNRHTTTLASYIWECKDRGVEPKVHWEVLRKCSKYKCGTRRCDLCLAEKLMILREKGNNLLNRRSELMSRCPHQRKWKLHSL